jgi:hypothetical protein
MKCDYLGVFCTGDIRQNGNTVSHKNGFGDQQQIFTKVFMWATIVSLSAMVIYNSLVGSVWSIRALFYGMKPDKHSNLSAEKYTMLDEVQAYVPQIKYTGLATNLLACDISHFDHEYIDWAGHFDEYSIFEDAKKDMEALEPNKVAGMSGTLFSICQIFPTLANPDPMKKVDSGDSGLGVMWVRLVSASGLIASDRGGASDPYAKISFEGMSWTTTVEHQTLDAEWDQEFSVPIASPPNAGAPEADLLIRVRDADFAGTHDFLGEAHFDMSVLLDDCEVLLQQMHADGRHVNDKGDDVPHDIVTHEFALLGKSGYDIDRGSLKVQFVWKPSPLRRTEIQGRNGIVNASQPPPECSVSPPCSLGTAIPALVPNAASDSVFVEKARERGTLVLSDLEVDAQFGVNFGLHQHMRVLV